METIIFTNEIMNGVLVDISSTHATANRINLPKDSYWFSVLYESCNKDGFDFGFDKDLIIIFAPSIRNDTNNEVLLSSTMLPYETGDFVMIFSILEKQDDIIIVQNLSLKDYIRIKKELRIRKNTEYLPIIWEKG